ncbi:hypothetical protein AHAS_Ahas20G0164700 [Arachis hypogaea]
MSFQSGPPFTLSITVAELFSSSHRRSRLTTLFVAPCVARALSVTPCVTRAPSASASSRMLPLSPSSQSSLRRRSHRHRLFYPNFRFIPILDAVLARVVTEKKMSLIKTWEESEKSRAENKTQKKLSSILSWENSKIASTEAGLKKIHVSMYFISLVTITLYSNFYEH